MASPDRNGGGWPLSEHGEKRELSKTKKQGSREGARERGARTICNQSEKERDLWKKHRDGDGVEAKRCARGRG